MDEWGEEEARELRRRLVFKQNLPSVDHVHLTLDMLLLEGRRLVRKERLLAPPPPAASCPSPGTSHGMPQADEQEHVMSTRLSVEYLANLKREAEVSIPVLQTLALGLAWF